MSIGCLHNYVKDLTGGKGRNGVLARETAGRRSFISVEDQSLLDWLFAEVETPKMDAEVMREIRYYLNVTRGGLDRIAVRSRHGSRSLLQYSSILLMKLSALRIGPVTAVKILNRVVRSVDSDVTVHELDELVEEQLAKTSKRLSRKFRRLIADESKLQAFESMRRSALSKREKKYGGGAVMAWPGPSSGWD